MLCVLYYINFYFCGSCLFIIHVTCCSIKTNVFYFTGRYIILLTSRFSVFVWYLFFGVKELFYLMWTSRFGDISGNYLRLYSLRLFHSRRNSCVLCVTAVVLAVILATGRKIFSLKWRVTAIAFFLDPLSFLVAWKCPHLTQIYLITLLYETVPSEHRMCWQAGINIW